MTMTESAILEQRLQDYYAKGRTSATELLSGLKWIHTDAALNKPNALQRGTALKSNGAHATLQQERRQEILEIAQAMRAWWRTIYADVL